MEWGRCAAAPNSVPAQGSGAARVLVCDDIEPIRTLLRVNLELEGYEVSEAADGSQALEMLADASRPLPDVITIDALMPRLDGWQTVAAIRQNPRLIHIPILMITASVQPHHRQQADRVGVDAFVAKPFEPEEVLSIVASLVRDGRVEPHSDGPGTDRP